MQKNMKAIMEYLRDHGLPMKKLVSEETPCGSVKFHKQK